MTSTSGVATLSGNVLKIKTLAVGSDVVGGSNRSDIANLEQRARWFQFKLLALCVYGGSVENKVRSGDTRFLCYLSSKLGTCLPSAKPATGPCPLGKWVT